ncbi:hypothetical protein OU568_26610 [Escherichia coli]|nr:hypothetical protein [Escherichia coli]
MKQDIEIGKTYGVSYPFFTEEVELPPDDPEATQMQMVKSWRPGVEWEQDDEYATHGVAEALGEMLLTVVDVHKPGRYPTRVFYTRQWKDPNGKVFGKAGLRITTLDAFRRRLRGYMHEFLLDGEKQPNA